MRRSDSRTTQLRALGQRLDSGPRHGERLARRLEAGAVNVNDMFTNVVAFPVPQSGWKESGVGDGLVARTEFASTAARRQLPQPG